MSSIAATLIAAVIQALPQMIGLAIWLIRNHK